MWDANVPCVCKFQSRRLQFIGGDVTGAEKVPNPVEEALQDWAGEAAQKPTDRDKIP